MWHIVMEPKTSPSPLTSAHLNQCTQKFPFHLTFPDGHRKAANKSFQSMSNTHDYLESKLLVVFLKYFKLKIVHFPVSSLEYAF